MKLANPVILIVILTEAKNTHWNLLAKVEFYMSLNEKTFSIT